MIGHWNSDEEEAMQYLPLRAQVIYLRGIRRFSGEGFSISWKTLSEIVEVRPRRSSKNPIEFPTREDIQLCIRLLERNGLVVLEPVNGGIWIIPILSDSSLQEGMFVRDEASSWISEPLENLIEPPEYKKQSIPTNLRLRVYERDGFVCQYCGSSINLSIDHIHPESKGGKTEEKNLQTLCKPCNSRKGAKLSE